MKRWISILSAVTSFAAVVIVSMYSLVVGSVQFTDASASPVYATDTVSVATTTSYSFEEAKTTLKDLGVELLSRPTISFGYASMTASDENAASTKIAAKMLAEEYSKYTPSYIKSTGLKKIYLVQNLAVHGQERGGMPEPIFEDALYFDVSSMYVQSEDGNYLRRTYHHEYKHLIDYNLFGSYQGDKAAWLTCNATATTYGNGGGSMYADASYAHEYHPEDGFITGYATSAIEEDMAETYAHFMTSPDKLQQAAAQDAALQCKVNLTKDLTAHL
jgi:hypothetical protein